MAGIFNTTARNALRWLTGASKVSDIDEGFSALAEDVDKKMASWWEGTHAARPAAGQANRLYKETDTNIIFHDTGSAWEPVMPFVAVRSVNGATAAVSGDLIYHNAAGEITLPSAATPNQSVVVFAGAGVVSTITTTGAQKIYGDFVNGATTIHLAEYQHVWLVSWSSLWIIVAGEPKREQKYGAWAKVAEKVTSYGVTPSTTRDAEVMLELEMGEVGEAAPTVSVGGVIMAKPAIKSSTVVPFASVIRVPTGQELKVETAGAKINVYTSTLLL
jgi:hypothetical protein